ncbi:hypothetical protein V8F33_005812 [Rhypophila sp. PSN 637]
MSLKRFLTALAAASSTFFAIPVVAEDRLKCGEASYFASEYTCHNEKTLCPTVFGLPTKPCSGSGSGGCYPPQQYSCSEEDGILRDLPEALSPFTLSVWGVRKAYQNQKIKACGGYLAFGANARQCHLCTAAGGKNCGSFKNETVFLPDGRMNAAVPGGQYWYVHPSEGLLQYTAALDPPKNTSTSSWNISAAEIPRKEFAGVNVKVHENGFFVWDKEGSSSHWWFACLVTLPGGVISTGRSWRLYAPLTPDLKDCELVRVVATAVDKSNGVYKYS